MANGSTNRGLARRLTAAAGSGFADVKGGWLTRGGIQILGAVIRRRGESFQYHDTKGSQKGRKG
jgi:hypothetical protein